MEGAQLKKYNYSKVAATKGTRKILVEKLQL